MQCCVTHSKGFVESFYRHGFWEIRLVDVQCLNGYSNADRIVSVLPIYEFVEDLLGLWGGASIRTKQQKPKP